MLSSLPNDLLVGELVGFGTDTLQTPAASSHSQAASLLHAFVFVKELQLSRLASMQTLARVSHSQLTSFLHTLFFKEEHFGSGDDLPDLG
jgi:hypothetical protein